MRVKNGGVVATGAASGLDGEIGRTFAAEGARPVVAQAEVPDTRLLQSWTARFSVVSAVAIAVLIALAWIAFGFGSLGLSASGSLALALGILLSVGLGIGLMALVFYSERSGQDEAVSRASQVARDLQDEG